MTVIKTLNDLILNGSELIPAGEIVEDMPKAMIDELLPHGAIAVVEKEVVKAKVEALAREVSASHESIPKEAVRAEVKKA